MAQSPEYPDLLWMPPKSWTDANRSQVQLVVIHTTEGSATLSAAEDGASYDQRRTDGTSTHYFHDNTSTVQCVRTADQAHAARAQGNRRGIQHELCTRAGSANWNDSYHQAMLRKAAKQAARDSKKWGIPVRHLTVQQVADGVKGFCGHWDVTRAFPQDNGTHTDPGANFPWSQFLDMVRAELEGEVPLTNDDADVILGRDAIPNPGQRPDSGTNPTTTFKFAVGDIWARLYDQRDAMAAMKAQIAALGTSLSAAISALAAKDQVDESALAAALAPGLAAAVLAALPEDRDDISPDELEAAVIGAFRDLANRPAA